MGGLDCAGLVVVAYRDAGLPVKDKKAYGRHPYKNLMEQGLQRSFQPVAHPEIGDVLLMRFAAEPQHLAIYNGDTILHSYENVGRVVEQRFAKVWQARVVRAYKRV